MRRLSTLGLLLLFTWMIGCTRFGFTAPQQQTAPDNASIPHHDLTDGDHAGDSGPGPDATQDSQSPDASDVCIERPQQVATTSAADAIYSGVQRHVHRANGRYWVAFFDGANPVLYRSAACPAWEPLGKIPAIQTGVVEAGQDFSARFSGDAMIVAFSNATELGVSGEFNRIYYRHATLSAAGEAIWWPASSEDNLGGKVGSHEDRFLHVAFDSLSRPWLLGSDDTVTGWFGRRGSALTLPDWASRSAGEYDQTKHTGPRSIAFFPVASDGDMFGLTNCNYADDRDIIGRGWNEKLGALEPWQVVVDDDLFPCYRLDESCARMWAAARTANGQLQLVYIDGTGRIKHLRGTNAVTPVWSTASADVTSEQTHRRVALATAEDHLYLLYDKGDNRIYYRGHDDQSWGSEQLLKSSDTPLQGSFSVSEFAVANGIGVVWIEGAASPFKVMFQAISAD